MFTCHVFFSPMSILQSVFPTFSIIVNELFQCIRSLLLAVGKRTKKNSAMTICLCIGFFSQQFLYLPDDLLRFSLAILHVATTRSFRSATNWQVVHTSGSSTSLVQNFRIIFIDPHTSCLNQLNGENLRLSCGSSRYANNKLKGTCPSLSYVRNISVKEPSSMCRCKILPSRCTLFDRVSQ